MDGFSELFVACVCGVRAMVGCKGRWLEACLTHPGWDADGGGTGDVANGFAGEYTGSKREVRVGDMLNQGTDKRAQRTPSRAAVFLLDLDWQLLARGGCLEALQLQAPVRQVDERVSEVHFELARERHGHLNQALGAELLHELRRRGVSREVVPPQRSHELEARRAQGVALLDHGEVYVHQPPPLPAELPPLARLWLRVGRGRAG